MRYDPTLSSDLDRVRFHIGDTVVGDGPRPDRGNFEDAEITAMLAQWGEWPCAVSGLFETLAAEWSARPIAGPGELGTVHYNVAKQYRDMAELWRGRCNAADGTVPPSAAFMPPVGVQVVAMYPPPLDQETD